MSVARATLALAGLVILALVALALALPHFVDHPRLRSWAEETAFRALGRRIGYGRPSIALFPPALVLERPWVAATEEGRERLVEAERLALELAIWPLLEHRLVARSVVIEGLVLRVERDADGLGLPALPGAGGSGGGAIDVARVELVRAMLVLRDRTATPPSTSELRDIDLEIEPGGTAALLRLQGSFGLGGGRVAIAGRAEPDGSFALELEARSAALAWEGVLRKPAGVPGAFSAALRSAESGGLAIERASLRIGELRCEGRAHVAADGMRVALRSDWMPAASARAIFPALATLPGLDGSLRIDALELASAPAFRLTLRQSLREGTLRVGALDARGASSITASLTSVDPIAGSVALDLGGAAVALGELVAKPAGMPSRVAADVAVAADGAIALRDAQIEIAGLSAEGEGSRAGERLRLDLRTGIVDARAAAAFLPDLAEIPEIGGAFALRSLRVETQPLAVRADVDLEGLLLTPGTPAPLRVHGPISLRDQTARASGLVVDVGGQPMALDGEIRLGEEPSFSVRARLRGADAKSFLRALLPRPPGLEGRLDLDADLSGPLGSASLVDSVAGDLRIHVAEGRIAGVSILDRALAAFQGVDRLTGLSRVLPQQGGASAEREGDRFHSLHATVRQAGGVSRTDDLRIAYPTYEVALAGELRLSESTLRMRGEVVFGDRLVGPIGRGLGLFDLACAVPNHLPIPEISGPLSDPRVRPDAAYLLGFVSRCKPLGALDAARRGILGVPRALGDALRRGARDPQEPAGDPQPAPESDSRD